MKNWKVFLLKEGISDIVYHTRTEPGRVRDIMKNNRFLANGTFSKEVEGQFGKGKLYFFSTSRTPVNTYTGDYTQGTIFKLDGKKLREKYKGNTIDYYGSKDRSSKKAATGFESEGFEAEDRVLLDEPYIENADYYIEEIHFGIPMYRMENNFLSDGPELTPGRIFESSVDMIEEASEIAKQKGIPFYIHISPETWPHVEVGKKKALKSFDELRQKLESFPSSRITPKTDRADYISPEEIKGKSRGIDRLELFVKMATSILSNKTYDQFIDDVVEKETKPGEIYSGLYHRLEEAGELERYDEERQKKENNRRSFVSSLYRDLKRDADGAFHHIRTEMHNLEKSIEARPVVSKIGDLLRKTRTSTVVELMNYLKKMLEGD